MQKSSKQQKIPLLENLQELQYRVKRTPEHYIPEMLKAIENFKVEFEKVKLSPQSKNESFAVLVSFLAQVAELYKNNLSFLHVYLNDLLENYASVMSPFLREKCVGALVVLRNKQMIKPIEQLNTMLKLFRVQDKNLRKLVAAHVMSDIRKLKQNSQNQSIFKQMQNLIFEILKNNSDALAKYSVKIMISMYKKNIWNDAKTINIIAHGCFNDLYKIRLICCYFLIETTVPKQVDSSDEEDDDLNAQNMKLFSKKTRAKLVKQEKKKKIVEKKRKRRQRLAVNKNFFPIDQIYNPQVFCEKLFNILKKNTKDRFEVKVVEMNVLARMIGRHKLFIMNFYSYCQKYLYPHQKDVEKFLAFLAEACHSQIPQEEVLPIIKHIVTNFVSDRCQEQKITMGINAIREICIKNPMAIDEFNLNYVAEYYQFKNKNVAVAAKSLINYYRDVNPALLEKKFRGRVDDIDEEFNQLIRFGEDKVYENIPGIELLREKEKAPSNGVPIEMDRIFDDNDFKKIRNLQQKKKEVEIMKNEEELQKRRLHLMDEEEQENLEEFTEEDEEEEIDDLDDEEDMISISSGEEIEDEDDEDEEEDTDKEEEKGEKKKKLKKANAIVDKEETYKHAKQSNNNDELEIEQESNPHGFLSGNMINDYKMTKSEKKRFMKDANLTEDKYKHEQKEKTGAVNFWGTSNKEKLKNKPLTMLRPKKNKLKLQSDDKKVSNLRVHIRSLKMQLGHFGKGTAHKTKNRSKILRKKISK